MDLNLLACQDTPESRNEKSSYLQRSLGRSSRVETPTFMKLDFSSICASPKIRPSPVAWGYENMNPNSGLYESRYLTSIEDNSRIEFNAESGQIAIDLYQEFLDLYTKFPNEQDVFELLQSFEKLCEKTADELKPILRKCAPTQQKYSNINSVIQELRLERNTWRLVRTLYKDRVEHRFDREDSETLMETGDKRMSDKQLIEDYFARNSTVRRCQLVVDWLEKNAADDFNDEYRERLHYFTDQGPVSWEHTLHDLKTKTPLGRPTQDSLITELDPDAPIRQRNNILHAEDKEIESRLLKIMFLCLRCGNLEEAQRTADSFGYPWLAASLEGWRLFHDPNYDNEMLAEGELLQPVEGNKYRDIWKAACWRMSQEPKIPMYQQALFGCLSGNLKAIIPACVNWYDYLWAYCRVFADMLTEKELRSTTQTNRTLEQLPGEYWDKILDFQQIFHDLNAVESIRKQGLGYHALIQKCIILDDVTGLIDTMHKWLYQGSQPPTGHLLRIMSHLVLFFRTIELSSKEELCVNILEAYVKELISQQKMPLVACYVATLPPSNQVHWYSKFLEGITDPEERELCLQYAEKAKLDTQSITKAVVSNVRSRVTDSEDPLSNITNIVTTEEDEKKISALGWLFYDATQRFEALKQSNALLRDFVLSEKLDAARNVMKEVPVDSVSVIMSGREDILPEEDNAIKEHLCFKAYIEALDVFNDWFIQYQQSKPPQPPTSTENMSFKDKIAHEHLVQQYELEKVRRAENLEAQTKITIAKLYNVLLFISGGWMVDVHETEEVDTVREKQMDMIRRLCIPKVTKLLHSVLLNTQQYIEIMQLADLIVSDQHNLHKVFDQEELQQLLSLIADASIHVLGD